MTRTVSLLLENFSVTMAISKLASGKPGERVSLHPLFKKKVIWQGFFHV